MHTSTAANSTASLPDVLSGRSVRVRVRVRVRVSLGFRVRVRVRVRDDQAAQSAHSSKCLYIIIYSASRCAQWQERAYHWQMSHEATTPSCLLHS
jgi:hypothetical protein